MDKLLEAIAILMGWANKKEVTTLLHEKAQPIAQHFIDMGHGIEREASKETIRLATEAKIKAENDLVSANATIENLKSQKPDLAQLQAQNQAALDTQKKDFEKREAKISNRLRNVLLARDRADLKLELVDTHHVDPEIAETFVNSRELEDRLDWNDKDETTVFMAGTKTPIVVASGQKWFQPVAEEIKGKVPKLAFTTDATEEGSGSSGHGSNSGGGKGKGKGKTVFDTIRANTLKDVETKSPDLSEQRKKRFGGGTPAR